MQKKYHRSGGVFGGTHTTYIPVAIELVDIAKKCRGVETIVAGIIKAGLPPCSQRGVKIIRKSGHITLVIRDTISLQIVNIHTQDLQNTILAIAKGARSKNMRISFNREKRNTKR